MTWLNKVNPAEWLRALHGVLALVPIRYRKKVYAVMEKAHGISTGVLGLMIFFPPSWLSREEIIIAFAIVQLISTLTGGSLPNANTDPEDDPEDYDGPEYGEHDPDSDSDEPLPDSSSYEW